jgi:antitoxin ParD1/3/4
MAKQVAHIDTICYSWYFSCMAARTTINVSLTPHLGRFVNARVASGRYQSASEVIRESLRLLEERETMKEATLGDLRKKIAVGLEQARRGDLLDGEQVFRQLEERTRKRRAR